MKALKKYYQRLLKNRSSRTVVLSGLLLVALGATWLLFSISPRADTATTASFQVEAAAKTGNITTVSDANAAGGQAVKFGAGGGVQKNCATKSSSGVITIGCGYPSMDNTGPLAGAVLTKVPSQATSGSGWTCAPSATKCDYIKATGNVGTATTGLELAPGMNVQVPDGTNNVTIQNIKISGLKGQDATAFWVGSSTCQIAGCGPNNITIQNCSASGEPGTDGMGLGVFVLWTSKSVSVKKCNFTNATSGIFYQMQNGTQVNTDNYIYVNHGWDWAENVDCRYVTKPDSGQRSHTNGIGSTDGPPDLNSSWLIEHNTLLMDTGCMTAVISFFNDGGPQNNTHANVNNNIMAGGNYTISNAYGGAYTPTTPYINISNNRYSTIFNPNGGYYALYYIFPPNRDSTTNTYGGNIWDDTGASADNSNWHP